MLRNCYIKTMNSKGHREFRVMSPGLTRLLSHSYLGASADGNIIDSQHPTAGMCMQLCVDVCVWGGGGGGGVRGVCESACVC